MDRTVDSPSDMEIVLATEEIYSKIIEDSARAKHGLSYEGAAVKTALIQAHWLRRIFEALSDIEMDLRSGRKG